MAIRFDKDTRRATNGPMIFFSDPSAEISLCDEIRGAIESRLSIYAYRRPGDMMITFGSSENVVEGISTPGFVIAPFLPSEPYLTIPNRNTDRCDKAPYRQYAFPQRSTSQEEHRLQVAAIISAIEKGGLEKAVAAKVRIETGKVDVGATFAHLCRRHPEAFVFCFSTPHTGCWIGASPELLLESHHGALKTASLAGTRAVGEKEDWDEKNLREQEIVTDYISDVLKNNALQVEIGSLSTVNAGAIEHLRTEISASLPPQFSTQYLENLLHHLSPTPAICGLPRNKSIEIIQLTENFQRGYYGGFCGPFRSVSDFSFYVILRCALIEQTSYALFAGGGITRLSHPASEWEETEIKTSTIKDSLQTDRSIE